MHRAFALNPFCRIWYYLSAEWASYLTGIFVQVVNFARLAPLFRLAKLTHLPSLVTLNCNSELQSATAQLLQAFGSDAIKKVTASMPAIRAHAVQMLDEGPRKADLAR